MRLDELPRNDRTEGRRGGLEEPHRLAANGKSVGRLTVGMQGSVAEPFEHLVESEPYRHYRLNTGPTHEFGDLAETPPTIRNIGWTLGNDCPYRCTHCYSMNARVKGMNMERWMIDRIVDQLATNGVETVNLGGNEPLFTNGPNPQNTLLPYIIDAMADAGIDVGLTTSGITLLHLKKKHTSSYNRLNDVDVSFDSPFEDEHNANRGARIFNQAIEALVICQRDGKPHTIIMCAMSWNFDRRRLEQLLSLALQYDANIRINPIKPTMTEHMAAALTPQMYYEGFSYLMSRCDPIDLGEPPIAAVTDYRHARRCPCGRTSFRIHSITPNAKIHVSPCVYLHDYKAPLDLLKDDLIDIINSPQFKVFRQRNRNPDHVEGCGGCSLLDRCGGGCAARSFLYARHRDGRSTFRARDPYCPKERTDASAFPQRPEIRSDQQLVHMDYLCTWIGRPRRIEG
jgi:radical SAM protein with 4Fe4S-binding SPASM domain